MKNQITPLEVLNARSPVSKHYSHITSLLKINKKKNGKIATDKFPIDSK